jgi:APA family basic amino acid/polyamine antiporter
LKTKAGWAAISDALLTQIQSAGTDPASLAHATAVFNVPAVLIIIIVTALLVIGIKESAAFNNIIVLVKLLVIFAFIGIGVAYINPANWHPFVPPSTGVGHFGWGGVLRAAGVIFFATKE